MRTRPSKWMLVALLAGGLATSGWAGVFAPYTSTTPGATDAHFTVGNQGISANGTESWLANTDNISNTSWGNGTAGFAVLQVGNLGGNPATANSFTESTDAKVTSYNDYAPYGSYSFGLGALGNDSLAFDIFNGDTWYAGQFSASGNSLEIDGEFGNNYSTKLVSAPFAGTFTPNTSYHLTLAGNYDASGDLTLAFTVSDGVPADTTTVSDSIAAASVLQGSNFGYLDQAWVQASGSVQYNNYDLEVVPEPTTLALVGIGLVLGLVARRRRS
ncbi:MAG TPA: PEP-CTERM sorting domain-containing protein [Verrucomicrobiae bacterium]|nr:PEP-CTERM sorting domain-containing protein [Verrucomicrobiae bacterium]